MGLIFAVHVDCDAFFASVEELERPELKNGTHLLIQLHRATAKVPKVPMAVGGSVLSTCNYKAREFGVRSGMAGHIAKSPPPLTLRKSN